MQEEQTHQVLEAAIKIQRVWWTRIYYPSRPDEKTHHQKDVYDLKPLVYQFNIEEILTVRFIDMVLSKTRASNTRFRIRMIPSLLTKVGIAKKNLDF